jgi:site-specific DNA-methyltransferase (adenine-specific)
MCSGSLVGTKSVPKYDLDFSPLAMGDRDWVRGALKVTRRWVVTFCDLEALGIYSSLYPEEYARGCVWYKPNSMGQLTADRPATSYEGLALFHPKDVKKRWNGKGSYGIWKCNGTRGKEARHPNEKPIDLCMKLVALFSERGETVFDPFCGSGVIGEACIRLDRHYIGVDQDRYWVSRTVSRLTQYTYEPVTDAEALSLCVMKDKT